MSLICLKDKTKQNNDWCANNDLNMRCLTVFVYFVCLFQHQGFWPEPVKHVNEMYGDLQTELFIANILKNKQTNKQKHDVC